MAAEIASCTLERELNEKRTEGLGRKTLWQGTPTQSPKGDTDALKPKGKARQTSGRRRQAPWLRRKCLLESHQPRSALPQVMTLGRFRTLGLPTPRAVMSQQCNNHEDSITTATCCQS